MTPSPAHEEGPANRDYARGMDRLDALITADLHTRVTLGDDWLAAVYGWGTLFNVVHYARGVRALHESGCCFATLPLVRALLEYTLGTLWIADAPQAAVEVLKRKGIFTSAKLDEEGQTHWQAQYPEEAIARFKDAVATKLGPHTDQKLSIFTNLLEEYGLPEWVAAYNALSTLSHLSEVGASRFVHDPKDGTLNLLQEPQFAELDLQPCVRRAFEMMLDAMAAYSHAFLVGSPWAQELEEIAADYGHTIVRAVRRPKGTPPRTAG